MKQSTDIIILGAKPIKGMKSLGVLSNIKINKNNNILDTQIYNLNKKIKVNNIIYVCGAQETKIHSENKITIIENSEYELKNNALSLKLAMKSVTCNYVIVLFNKILFRHNIFNRLDYNNSSVFINNKASNTYNIGCTINDESVVENLFYNLSNKTCGIYGLAKPELEILSSMNINDNFFIFEIINEIISNGGIFKPKYVDGHKNIIHVENNYTLKKIKRYYAQNFSI